ncbi:hypothetical protein A2U01_0101743, partial [Trifolium medium]|nr:hypothetical protein [Trifolium medium]
ESDLSLDYRLFEGTHAADIAASSAQKPTGAITRQQMITDLKLVSKALDDKKNWLIVLFRPWSLRKWKQLKMMV